MNFAGLSSPRIGGYLPTQCARHCAAEIPGAINGASTWDTRGTPGTRRAELRRRGMSSRHDSAAYFGRAARKADVQHDNWRRVRFASLPQAVPPAGLKRPKSTRVCLRAGVAPRPCHLSPTTQPHRWLVVPMRGGLRAS